MVGIVLVSHSAALAGGLAEIVGQVAGNEVRIETAGGSSDGRLGTSGDRVEAALAKADSGDGVVVLVDLGSSILVVRHVLDGLGANGRIRLVDAPMVEGAIAAGVVASGGAPVAEVAAAAESARDARKF
ncbi:MAG TPA: dihydroxyacetone kinase phosphoryl donor subunit DhaM [Candidatus Dormibacteraeota bacterium]